MATFVLVHGAWHGGWCWQKVVPFLEEASHEVYAPTLTGLAERAAELSPDVGLDTHIQDVVGLLQEKNLQGVILVGHSYGGMVITGSGFFYSFMQHLVGRRALPPKGAGWRLRQLPTGHDAMITMPRELAALLLEVV